LQFLYYYGSTFQIQKYLLHFEMILPNKIHSITGISVILI
ncbi:hypothetical protein T02_4872, partial [Trichinella nativa]